MKDHELYPFQQEGVEFLVHRDRAYLADQMGLGKTVQAIVAADTLGHVTRPMVVCPANARPNWEREWQTWEGPGTPEITSYAMLTRHGASREPDLLILDEAHYCKSPSAKRTRAALGLAKKVHEAGGYVWLMSGTPMPNDPTELWPPIKYVWPEIAEELEISTARQWMHRFCKIRVTQWGPKPYAMKNADELRPHLQDIWLRRTLDDVALELPPLRIQLSRLPKDRAVAQKLEEYEQYEASGEELGRDVYASTLRRMLGEAKAPVIARQIAEELDDGAYEHIVVLFYHTSVGVAMARELLGRGISVTGFDGSTSRGRRQEAIDRFQDDGAQVFLAQQTAAGVAITLSAANEIVLVEPAWTPAENQQAIKRIHRIGQDKPCRARIFTVEGTLDSSIMGTLTQKLRMQEEVGL